MKKAEIAIAAVLPSAFMARFSISLSMMQSGGSFLEFLRPVMPFFSQMINFFANLLIPLGEYFGTLLQGPLTTLSEAIPPRSGSGYALYFILFAGIFLVALFLNVIWRPLGYATTESKVKKEQKEEKKAERDAAKAEAKEKRQAAKMDKKNSRDSSVVGTTPDLQAGPKPDVAKADVPVNTLAEPKPDVNLSESKLGTKVKVSDNPVVITSEAGKKDDASSSDDAEDEDTGADEQED